MLLAATRGCPQGTLAAAGQGGLGGGKASVRVLLLGLLLSHLHPRPHTPAGSFCFAWGCPRLILHRCSGWWGGAGLPQLLWTSAGRGGTRRWYFEVSKTPKALERAKAQQPRVPEMAVRGKEEGRRRRRGLHPSVSARRYSVKAEPGGRSLGRPRGPRGCLPRTR